MSVLDVFFVTAIRGPPPLSPILQAGGDTALSDLLLPVQTPLAIRQSGVPPPVLGPRRGHVGELVLLGEQDALVLVAHRHQLGDALADEVEHLADAHEDAQGAGHHHEEHEDLLLGRAADEAVNGVGTRCQGAFGQPTREEEGKGLILRDDLTGSLIFMLVFPYLLGQVISMIYPVQDVEKAGIKASFEDQAEQVGPPQASSLLAGVGIQVGAVVLLHILGILALAELDVSHHHQRRAGDENELQCPQANVGDGEDVVIADVGAAGLEKNRTGD